jgi:hypothetical protein
MTFLLKTLILKRLLRYFVRHFLFSKNNLLKGTVYEFFTWDGSPFRSYDFSNMGSLDVKPVSLICKMLP